MRRRVLPSVVAFSAWVSCGGHKVGADLDASVIDGSLGPNDSSNAASDAGAAVGDGGAHRDTATAAGEGGLARDASIVPDGSGGSDGAADAFVAGEAGGTPCGSGTCLGGQFCCDQACGLCLTLGSPCIPGCRLGDGSGLGCVPVSSRDGECADAGLPHYYQCMIVNPPSACVILFSGDVLTTACCP
jgi:hypothetical protein